MADQLVLDNFYQPTSLACIVDLIPPTFGGITGLSAPSNGSLVASWSAGTDPATPVQYDVFIQAGTATGLFNTANKALTTFGLSRAIFALADGTLLLEGVTYFVGVRARDGVGNSDSNSVSLSAVSAGVPASSILSAIAGIWDQLRASHTVSGSFGQALQAKVDVDVSTRLAAASYTAPDNASITAIKAKTDNLPADPASNTQVLTRAPASTALDNTIWTSAKAAFIDAAISSRSTGADMATALAGISAIFARTDVATSTRATPGDITAAQTALATLINAVAGNVWEQLISAHNTAGTFGANAQTPAINPTQVADAVWNALVSAHTVAGSFGLVLQTPLSAGQIANAVWDALTASHTAAGSFGLNAQNPPLSPSAIASAVWDAVLNAYQNVGSTGEALKKGGSGGGGGGLQLIGYIGEDGLTGEVGSDPIIATVEE